MIEVKNVVFSYGKMKENVFNGLSLRLEEGGVYGLLGKNGTGKSTLLYLLTGLLRPQQGEVLYKGTPVVKRLPSTLQEMYLIPEEIALPDMTMKQFVEMNAPFYPRFSREQLRTTLQGFGMDESIRLGQLSMGQKKKAFISFALATNTQLLILDEPTNGLDIPSKSEFRKLIASNMTDEKTIIISTHQVRDIDSLLDHVTIIDGSELLLNESVANICRKLYFAELSLNEPADNVLFSLPSVQGNSVILSNVNDLESEPNVELLFQAMLAERAKMKAIFAKH